MGTPHARLTTHILPPCNRCNGWIELYAIKVEGVTMTMTYYYEEDGYIESLLHPDQMKLDDGEVIRSECHSVLYRTPPFNDVDRRGFAW